MKTSDAISSPGGYVGSEAQAEVAEVLRIEPAFTINRWKMTAVYKATADAEHLFEGLRKAGLPES
jgi:hypothetical protein